MQLEEGQQVEVIIESTSVNFGLIYKDHEPNQAEQAAANLQIARVVALNEEEKGGRECVRGRTNAAARPKPTWP